MAEVALGVTGSVVGVAGFALQLAETVVKLKSFCDNVKDAPTRLQELVDRIEVTSNILTKLVTEKPGEIDVDWEAFEGSLALCKQAVERITAATANLQRRMGPKRLLTSVKYVLKAGEIEDLLRDLDRGKGDLQLAHAMYSEARRKASEARQESQMTLQLRMLQQLMMGQAQIVQGVQVVSTQTKDLGVVYQADQAISSCSKRRRHASQDSFTSTLLHIRSPTWFSRQVWDVCVKRAVAGWNISLSTYRIISTAHSIWDLCWFGDLAGVQRMLDSRMVSLHDQDPEGRTLFFAAAIYGHTELAQFLKNKGADSIAAPTHNEYSATDMYAANLYNFGHWVQMGSLASIREHTKFLIEDCEILSIEGEYWMPEITLRVSTLWNYEDRLNFLFNLNWCTINFKTVVLEVLGDFHDPQYYLDRENMQTTLLHCIASACAYQHDGVEWPWSDMFHAAIQAGADIHALDYNDCTPFMMFFSGLDIIFTEDLPNQETIVNVGLRSWARALIRAGINLEGCGEYEAKQFRKHISEFEDNCIGFSFGPKASDWHVWFRHLGDEYAGDFWDMLEHPERAIPGAWNDD